MPLLTKLVLPLSGRTQSIGKTQSNVETTIFRRDLFQALQNIQALQNMPRQNIGQKKLRKKKKKNTQVIYLGWILIQS